MPFQERKKFRQILYSKASIVALFVVFVFVVHGAWNIHKKALIARAESEEALRILKDMEARSEELQESLAELKTSQGFEKELRQKFAVARPGEEVVIVVDEKGKKSENMEESGVKGFWAQILEFFGK